MQIVLGDSLRNLGGFIIFASILGFGAFAAYSGWVIRSHGKLGFHLLLAQSFFQAFSWSPIHKWL